MWRVGEKQDSERTAVARESTKSERVIIIRRAEAVTRRCVITIEVCGREEYKFKAAVVARKV